MFSYPVEVGGKRYDIQSIYCVGRNYTDHIKELANERPSKPLIFVKPKGSLSLNRRIKVPDNTKELHHEGEIVLLIGKDGFQISESSADSFIAGITVGLDLTARDLQNTEKANGHPWMLSKCQKDFCVIGDWQEYKKNDYEIELKRNNQSKQKGLSSQVLFDFAQVISYLSSLVPLYEGDVIFTGTPAGVGIIESGDVLELFLNGKKLLHADVD